MSQGSGSPVAFLDATTCNDILADIRQPDGTLPDFGSIPSEPGTLAPELEVAVAQGHKETQTYPVSTSDQSTQVLSHPHQGTSATQTLAPPLWTGRTQNRAPPTGPLDRAPPTGAHRLYFVPVSPVPTPRPSDR